MSDGANRETVTQTGAEGWSFGGALRGCRRERGLTLKAVSDKTGLTIGFLSEVERDMSSLSLSSLIAVSRAIGVGIERFTEPPEDLGGVTRAPERTIYRVSNSPVGYERLSAGLDGGVINAVRMRVPPGYRSEQLSHYGEELMYVLDGTVYVTVAGQETELRAGDSVHFSSRRAHCIHNRSTSECLVLWTGTLPLFEAPGLDDGPAHGAVNHGRANGNKL